jgi:hypothetical protein
MPLKRTGFRLSRLCCNSKKSPDSDRHAGLDPASSSVTLSKNWIPGQARNDKNTPVRSFANHDTVSFAGMTGMVSVPFYEIVNIGFESILLLYLGL